MRELIVERLLANPKSKGIIAFMDELSKEQMRTFFAKYKKISYKKREMIVRAGDIPSGVYFIESGYVREYSISPNGDEFVFFLYKEDDVFPLRWALTSFENERYFETYEDTVVWRAPREEFLLFLRDNPQLLFSLTTYMFSRLGMLMDKIDELIYGNAASKVANGLIILINRFGEEKNGEWVVPISFTHKDIAALIGSTRETVSIEMQKLIKEEVIIVDKQVITIKNLDTLKTISQIA